MKNIHWLGSGLSSIPGIRRLASNNYNLTVWNRTLSKAEKSIDHVKTDNVAAKTFNINEIADKVEQGDIIVSQLTASMHLDIAKICLEKKCHFVTTSYLAPDIKNLNESGDRKIKKLPSKIDLFINKFQFALQEYDAQFFNKVDTKDLSEFITREEKRTKGYLFQQQVKKLKKVFCKEPEEQCVINNKAYPVNSEGRDEIMEFINFIQKQEKKTYI